MADIAKTVGIIFKAQDQTSGVVDKLADNLRTVGDAASASDGRIDEIARRMGSLGERAKDAEIPTAALGNKLRDLAADAGVPAPILGSIDGLLTKIGTPVGGSAIVAAAAIAAFAIAFGKVGSDARDFKIALENVSGGAIDSERALKFVIEASKDLETKLNDTLAQYQRFLTGLQGTGIATEVAEQAFRGISAAVEGIGGNNAAAQRALDAFVKIARDGKIDLKDLGSTIAQIPGGLRILEEALGVPLEDLRLLAEKGHLGKEAIELFAQALNNQKYNANISPINDAFNDLWNTLKRFALDLGADGLVSGGLWILEKAIRGVTVGVTIGVESLKVYGETLANIAYSLKNADGAGFLERQREIMARFETNVQGATDKFLGLEKTLGAADARPATTAYAELAAKLRETGDSAEKAASKTLDVNKAARDAAKTALDWVREENKKAATLAKVAETLQKSEEAAQKYHVAMEKIASDERIKAMEFTVNFNIAKLEEDTKRVQAAFDSINNTMNSTGDVISSALGLLKDFDSLDWGAIRVIEQQLEQENKIRRENFDLQKKLAEAQIENLRAQTQQIEKGDALIKIDGAGLQPHLEAFMWEILKAIQVRVNRDGLHMLLGV